MSCLPFHTSLPFCEENGGTRQQININTHFVDASLVYGHSDEIAVTLRSFVDGKLLVGDFNLLPETKNEDGNPVEFSGDSRHKEVPGIFICTLSHQH